jgi:hypothetical protein
MMERRRVLIKQDKRRNFDTRTEQIIGMSLANCGLGYLVLVFSQFTAIWSSKNFFCKMNPIEIIFENSQVMKRE